MALFVATMYVPFSLETSKATMAHYCCNRYEEDFNVAKCQVKYSCITYLYFLSAGQGD